MLIGLTGSFGTGKSTVAGMFKESGGKVIDADSIVRRILGENQKIIKKVAKTFAGVILASGDINRAQLATIVFQNPRELKKLTDILYPEAFKEVRKQISQYTKEQMVVLDVPLLFEAGWDRLTDINIVVTARREDQFKRLQKRMAITKAQILQRLKMQMPLRAKAQLADIVIDNSRTLKITRQQVDAVIDRLHKRKS